MRKTTTTQIKKENRDHGKVFFITEMSASAAERWALRAGFALMNAGVDIPELDWVLEAESVSMADLASLGAESAFKALGNLDFDTVEPLLKEMMACVTIIPDPSKPEVTRSLIEEDIEEVSTRFFLRKAVWDLHVDFFPKGTQLTSNQSDG